MRNILLVISGPSGVGKGTIVNRLMQSGEYALSVSCTTRSPRTGEKEGKSYFFLSREEFLSRIRQNDFLEYDEHFGNLYGTPKSFVESCLKERSVILEIDVVGALNVKNSYPEAVLIMLLPPDLMELRARLIGRDSETNSQLETRLERAKFELSQKNKFDYKIVNDDLDLAEAKLREIVQIEKNKV